MTVSFVGANGASALAGSCTISKPTTSAGDVMLTVFMLAGNTTSVSALTGWTLIAQLSVSTGSFFVFTKIAGSSEPGSYAWTGTFSSTASGACIVYTGSTPAIDVSSSSVSETTTKPNVISSITTTKTGVLVCIGGKTGATGLALSTPTGFTFRADLDPYTGAEIKVCDIVNSTIGATGSVSQTWTTGTTGFGVLINIADSGSSGGGGGGAGINSKLFFGHNL